MDFVKIISNFVTTNKDGNEDMTTSGGKHEKAFKNMLTVPEMNRKDFLARFGSKHKEWRTGSKVLGKDENFFVSQPNSSQRTPDFYVIVNGVFFRVDLKSSKSKHAVWNSGLPKRDTIYVITTKDGNFLFLGKHLIDKKTRIIYKRCVSRMKQMAKQCSIKLKTENEPWNLSTRPAHNDKNDYTKMTTCKDKVLKFIETSLAAPPHEDDYLL